MVPYTKLLKKESLPKLLTILSEQGRQIIAPVSQDGIVAYRRVDTPFDLDFSYILPDTSIKEVVFPRTEKLFAYVKSKESVEVTDFNFDAIPYKVMVGVRPCDAAGLLSLSAIFNWDPKDPIFNARMERTTFIGMSCAKSDEYCFCTSVDLGPGSTKGSDILLTTLNDGHYMAEILTEKGEAVVALAPEFFEEAQMADKVHFLAVVPVKFEKSKIFDKLREKFDSPVFSEQAMACVGCGTCAYVCPICACFDIQEQTKGNKGSRVRCWDSCGMKLFTLHTSGHNPRNNQGQRWRQRLMHKFSYMPERLDVTGCVGCGRCSRNCPVDMNMAEHLSEICE